MMIGLFKNLTSLFDHFYKRGAVMASANIERVSVIIPAKNEGTNVKMTVDSIINNSSTIPYEVILVDDGSQDDCCRFLVDDPGYWQGKGVKLIKTNSVGSANARNTGAACRDFCHQDNAYLISAAKEWSYEKAVYSMETPGYPFWYRPDKEHLQRLMRYVFENREEAKARGLLAQQEISTKHTWAKTAEVIMERLLAFKDR